MGDREARARERAQHIQKALERDAQRGRDPWLQPASINSLAADVLSLGERLAHADEFLKRLSEWDMLFIPTHGEVVGQVADAAYWKAEITKAREVLAGGVVVGRDTEGEQP